jgi:hypothetical protein
MNWMLELVEGVDVVVEQASDVLVVVQGWFVLGV